MIWYSKNDNNDIMVSTRVRVARNIKKYPFPTMMTADDAKKVLSDVKGAIENSNSSIAKEFEYMETGKMSPVNLRALTEQHFISPDLAKSKYGAVLINKDRTMSIMINEEDHIRLQVILPGLEIGRAWETANRVDDLIEESVEYAFDEKLGYLTACPTNLGTGIRVSVMMHLPALTMTREISKIIDSAGSLGIAVRGIYGEGSDSSGNLYQISNSITMGASEEELAEKVENIAKQIEGYEREARKSLLKNHKTYIKDKVWRSYGILKYARQISSKESKSLISDVILGKALNIIDEPTATPLFELMVKTEPANIGEGKEMSADERDIKRADLIRDTLTGREG